MSDRWLKIALAVSVALNVFAVAAGATAYVGARRAEAQIADQRRPDRGPPILQVVDQMDPAKRDQVREALRASALAARPDFDAARAARRQAMEAAGADPFDQARVQGLLEQSRLAEMRGRARLESGALAIFSGLSPADRKALAPILIRHGKGERGGRRGGRDAGPPPPPAPDAG
ncbi:MAG: periplasmic heavy metal sensor [Brevundimonas sp.]|nr:MAG: periplasmic heavy metal sensor [Brevundimonas sp.]